MIVEAIMDVWLFLITDPAMSENDKNDLSFMYLESVYRRCMFMDGCIYV